MRILAFDTATLATSAALMDSDTGLELEARDDPPVGARPRHVTQLLVLIAELLARAGGGWEAVDRIAVGVGPGTFTGLRIGVATGRALAQAREIPLVGISTLRSIATNAQSRPGGEVADAVLAVLDARRGEAFAAAWRLSGRPGADGSTIGERLLDPRALGPASLGELVPGLGRASLAIGAGAIEFRLELERCGAAVPADDSALHKVSALNHCRLALGPHAGTGRGEVRPDYLRLPDAELARRRRAG